MSNPDMVSSKKGGVTYVEAFDNDPTPTTTTTTSDKVVLQAQDSRFGTYLATHKPSALSKSMLALYPILAVACMNSAANGFDGNTFGGASSLPDFQARFGTGVASSQGFLAAIYILGTINVHAAIVILTWDPSIGNVIGSFVAGPLADGLGRKLGMVAANVVVIIGSVIQAAAYKRREMIVGRVILGIGSVMLGEFEVNLARVV